jgi:hypothetical protein
MTNLDRERVLILGSHSRNSECEIKKNRQRFAQIRIIGNRLQPIGEAIQSDPIESQVLFDGVSLDANKIIQAVSSAIATSERAANLAQGDKKACQKANAFNAEGAVALPGRSSGSTVWIGLRSPLVFIEQKNFAILLRMKSLKEYRFDEVALLDLEGRGRVRTYTRWQHDLGNCWRARRWEK